MAAPIQGPQVAQQAQQATQKDVQQAKVQDSKFDGVMAQKANGAQAAGQVQQANQVGKAQQVTQAQKVSDIQKADKAQMNKTGALQPKSVDGAGKPESGLMKFVGSLEQHQTQMNSILHDAMSGKGKKMDFQQLQMLQMQVYQYSQEMDLTSKVVEKATSGLKDTLKTQV